MPKTAIRCKREEEIVGHGMRPARRIGQVLPHPEQQHRGNDRKLAGDDQEGMAQVAPLIQRLYLVGGQIALFGGKKGICHRVAFSRASPNASGPAAYHL